MGDKQLTEMLEEWLYTIAPEPLKEIVAELIDIQCYTTAKAMIDVW